MADRVLTVRDMLDLDTFDPMNIDMSEFSQLSESMPRDANIDIAVAEKLASQYLRSADRCSEILSTLVFYEQKAKNNKNMVRARLYLRAKDEGHNTVAERNAYVESHDSYLEALELHARIQAVKTLFELKHESYLNGHRFMKDKFKSEQRHLQLSGFSETAGSGEKPFGEREW